MVRDKSLPVGALDDVCVVVIVSLGFMLLCPERLVEAHAIRAASARDGYESDNASAAKVSQPLVR